MVLAHAGCSAHLANRKVNVDVEKSNLRSHKITSYRRLNIQSRRNGQYVTLTGLRTVPEVLMQRRIKELVSA